MQGWQSEPADGLRSEKWLEAAQCSCSSVVVVVVSSYCSKVAVVVVSQL